MIPGWIISIGAVLGLPIVLAALARFFFEDKGALAPPENWREIADPPCDRPCSDAAGTCDVRCPHLRKDYRG